MKQHDTCPVCRAVLARPLNVITYLPYTVTPVPREFQQVMDNLQELFPRITYKIFVPSTLDWFTNHKVLIEIIRQRDWVPEA